MALLKAPVGAGVPAISGGGEVGQQLTCGGASWAGNLVSGFLLRSPTSYGYRWAVGSEVIGGATGSTHVPTGPGVYRCEVTAINQAGSAAQISGPRTVTAAPLVFSIAPAVHTFGTQNIDSGATVAKWFTVTNPGTTVLDIEEISLVGDDADQFAISFNTCGTTVAASGGSCVVDVRFDPSSAGEKVAQLRFVHAGEDSPSSVEVTGTAVADPEPPDDPSNPIDVPGADVPAPPATGSSGLPVSLPPALPASAATATATVFSAVLSVDRRGRVAVVLECTGSRRCSGTLDVRSAKSVRVGNSKRKRVLTIARGRYSELAPGRSSTVKLRMEPAAQRALSKMSKVRVVVTARSSNPVPAGSPNPSARVATLVGRQP